MARKAIPIAEEPVQPDGLVRTKDWPNGIQFNPHVLPGCGGKCAPEPDFHPQPQPAPQPNIPETE